MFKFLPSNRVPSHAAKIENSIIEMDKTAINPIQVALIYDYLYIIEGQARFLACKSLSIPVYFIIDEDTTSIDQAEKVMILLNRKRQNWGSKEYLHHFVARGFIDYLNVNNIINETGFSVSQIMKIWQSSTKPTSIAFSSGKYEFGSDGIQRVRAIYQVYKVALNKLGVSKFTNSSRLIGGIMSVLLSGASMSKLIYKLETFNYLFKIQGSEESYRDLLEYIYNYRERSANKKSFKYNYNSSMGRAVIVP